MLNKTASYVWAQLDGNTSAEEIADLLVKEFDTARSVAAQDVGRLIEEFSGLNLLTSDSGI